MNFIGTKRISGTVKSWKFDEEALMCKNIITA
jgi:hypothetical protein